MTGHFDYKGSLIFHFEPLLFIYQKLKKMATNIPP